jgi:hypothetical protein
VSDHIEKSWREVTAPDARAMFERWLGRGDHIGAFVNVDLSSAAVGQTLYLPLDTEARGKVVIGESKAPDTPQCGPGWRYILQAIITNLDELTFKPYVEPEPKPAPKKRKRK